MTPDDLTPVTLMIEMRERLVRIETKMDGVVTKSDDHEDRIAELETNAAKLKTSLRTLQWVAAAVVGMVTFFSDHLANLIGTH